MSETKPGNDLERDFEHEKLEREILLKFLEHSKQYQSALASNPKAKAKFNDYNLRLNDFSELFNRAGLRLMIYGEEFALVPREVNATVYANILKADSSQSGPSANIQGVMAVAQNSSLNNFVNHDRYMISHVSDVWMEKILSAIYSFDPDNSSGEADEDKRFEDLIKPVFKDRNEPEQ